MFALRDTWGHGMQFSVRPLTIAVPILLMSCTLPSLGPDVSMNYTRTDGRRADPAELGAAFTKCQMEASQSAAATNACMARDGYVAQ